MVCRIEGYFGYRSMGIDAFLDRERRTARLSLTHQARMARMRGGIEGQPVKWIAATDEGREFGFAKVGQQPSNRRLSCCCTRTFPFAAEPARDHFDCPVVKLAQQRRLPAVPHFRTDRPYIGRGKTNSSF